MSKKILVIHTSFLGDAILAIPFLQELQKEHPNTHIDVLTAPRAHDIFRSSSVVQKIHILDKRHKHKGLLATFRFGRELREDHFDAVYSLHRSFRTSVLVWALGVKPSFGFTTASASFVYSNLITYDAGAHEVQRLLAFLKEQYLRDAWRILPVMQSGQFTGAVEALMNQKNIPEAFIGIAPGSVWATKRYPAGHYKMIVQALEKQGRTVVLIGGQDEKEICMQVAESTKAINVCGLLPLIAVKELLLHCALLITNDSALTHLGMAADCQTLTIYCSTVPAFGFYPYSTKGATIGLDDLACKPCGIHGHMKCPKKHFNCGVQLTPDMVMQKINGMLEGKA